MGNAFLSGAAATRLAPVSAALLAVVWVAEMIRIFRPAPLLGAIAAACLVAYTALALARASGHIRLLFLLALGASVAIAALVGTLAIFPEGFARAQVFGAFLPSVLMLRATVEVSPRIARLRGDLGRFDPAQAQAWMQYGSHALGSVLNVGAMAVLAPAVARDAQPARRIDLALAAARGVGGANMWSPFFLALAFTSQMVPAAPMWQAMAIGMGIALAGFAISWLFFTPSLGARGFLASVGGLAPLAGPMLVVVGSVVAATLAFRWSGLQAVAVVIPILCIAYLAFLGGGHGGRVAKRTIGNFSRLSDELLIVVGATILGAAMATLPAVRELGERVTPDMISGAALLAALVFALLLLGQAGLHPMIGVSIALPVLGAGDFGLCAAVLVAAGVFSWALNASVSIWTLPVAVGASAFEVPARRMLTRRTLLFGLVHAAAGVLFLALVNAAMGRWGCA